MSLPAPYYDRDGITVYCADCRDVLPHLGRFDLLLTDPPYGIGMSSNPVRQKHGRSNWDDAPPEYGLIQTAVGMSQHSIIWGGNYFPLPPSRAFLVWNKQQPEEFSLAMVEQAWCSWSGNAKLFTRRVVGFHKWHATQKPTELMQWCLVQPPIAIKTVLDPFGGSLTTAVACKLAGVQCTIIEQSEEYCRKGVERLRQGVLELTG